MNAAVPSAQLLFTTVCSAVFLGCNAARCWTVADGVVVVLETVADVVVLAAVVTVTVDVDNADVDVGWELGAAASAFAIPASRRLRIKPTD